VTSINDWTLTLILTWHLAIQAYRCTLMGRNLENIIVPEVKQICLATTTFVQQIDIFVMSLTKIYVWPVCHKICAMWMTS
jgi:hypothetical protein